MFLAVCVVGEYVIGKKDEYPPPLKGDSQLRYETTVNTMADPSIYVTYKDGQAYPLYICSYTCFEDRDK